MTNLREHFIRFHKVFWPLLYKLEDHFCRTYEFVRNFFRRSLSSLCRKRFSPALSKFGVWQYSGCNFQAPRRFQANMLKILRFYLKHPRHCWKHKLLKEGQLSIEKIVAYLFSYYRVWQTSGDFLQCSTEFWASFVRDERSYL